MNNFTRYISRMVVGRHAVVLAAIMSLTLVSCIEDGYTTSPSDVPTFSCDTLRMGDVFTGDPTPTKRFTVYNRHDKMLSISSISLRDDDSRMFRINVDGMSGRDFANVDIRPNDSIMIFVEATLAENGSDAPANVRRHLDFVTNGRTQTVVIDINGQDVTRQRGLTITENTTWTAGRPYVIFDTLRVAEGVTLTLEPGTRLRFHDKAAMVVDGTLRSVGTPDAPVQLYGDRDGFVAAAIPYEVMSGQWGGIDFTPSSRNNHIEYTSIRNSLTGLTLDSIDSGADPALTMVNSVVRNTANYVVDSRHSNLRLVGCELAEASSGILRLVGGRHDINHCTIANYYLFTAIGGPAVQFEHIDADSDDLSGRPFMSADITNTIIYGIGAEVSHGDLTGRDVFLRRCLLRSAGTDDDNFIDCIWDEDPLYYTVRSEYYFDYRLQPDSPAIGQADPTYDVFGVTDDFYGAFRGVNADLGAYTFIAPEE